MNTYKALIFGFNGCKECLIDGSDIQDAITKLSQLGYTKNSILKIRLVSSSKSENLTERIH